MDYIYEQKNRLKLREAISEELGFLSVSELESHTDSDLEPCYQQFLNGIFRHTAKGLNFGMVIFKPFIRGGEIRFSVVTPDNFKILLWDEQQKIPVTTEFYEHRGDFTRVETHEILSDGYLVTNRVLNKHGKEVSRFPDVFGGYEKQVKISSVNKPLFGLFTTKDGLPVHHRANDLIADAERQYERLLWEFESGERALYVSDTAFLRDFKGKPKVPDKKLYRLLSASDELFKDWTPQIRDTAILNGLDAILKRIEDCVGISRGTFSDISSSPRTATELKMSRHRTYSAVCEIQKALKSAVEEMLYGAAVLLCLYEGRKTTRVNTEFNFGDSVLDVA